MDVRNTTSTPTTSVQYLDELQQHFNYETDSGTRFRSQSFGAGLAVEREWLQKRRMQDGTGSMIEQAISLIKKWDPVTPAGQGEGRSRAASCSTADRVHRHLDPPDARLYPAQERGNMLLNKLTGSDRDIGRRGSVSRSRAGSSAQELQEEMDAMEQNIQYLTVGNGTERRSPMCISPATPPSPLQISNNNRSPHEDEKRGFDLTSWSRPNNNNNNMTLLPRPAHTGLLVSGISSPMAQQAVTPTGSLEMLASYLPAFLTDRRWQDPIPVQTRITDPIEMQAKAHRASAARSDPKCTWSGQLPVKVHKNPVYSSKVFLGGVPFDISDQQLIEAFSPYGQVRVQWPPNRQQQQVQQENRQQQQKCGYVYIIFDNDKNVKALLAACTHDYTRTVLRYLFPLSSRRTKLKEVEVIPWNIADSNFVKSPAQRLDTSKTVFVGALHGMLTAEGLATVMNDLFGGVAYVGIDTDKYKYPIGSARLTFTNQRSYMKAVQAEFVEIKAHFQKKIQCDPYIVTALCSTCNLQQGSIFCRNPDCFRYYCRCCWGWVHSAPEMDKHKPLMRYRRE
jgi:cytoplasmic polyadenylation element-binding protein